MREWGKVRSRRRQPQTYHGRSVVRGTWHALRLFVSLPWILLRIISLSSIRLYSAFLSLLHCLFPVSLLPFLRSVSLTFSLVATPFYTFVLRFCFFPTFSSLLFSPHFSLPLSLSLFPSVRKDPTRFNSVRCCVNQNNRFDRSGWESCSCRNIINIVSGIQRKIYDAFHAIFV